MTAGSEVTVSVAGVVPLIGETFSHDPGWSVTENGAGPESLVREIVCGVAGTLNAGAVKLRLAGAAEITGTGALVTVRETDSNADCPGPCPNEIDP